MIPSIILSLEYSEVLFPEAIKCDRFEIIFPIEFKLGQLLGENTKK